MYTAPKCPHSKNIKEFLIGNDVEIDERCVLTSPVALDELRELSGQMGIPVTKIDDEVFIGFDRRVERRIKRKIGV